ncbi:MAG: hypothetical protein PHH98_04355 [Candidatus Gracilibacteria bacterium]|nr:hypothetical protein [Candidatus Gracilibacteria bacterium]
MRNKINIFLLSVLIFLLTSCFSSNNDDINKAKEELLNGNNPIEEDYNVEDEARYDELEKNQKENIEESVIINDLTTDSFIKIDNIDKDKLSALSLEITGTTTTNVDKIIVNFSNSGSTFKEDNYTLKTFKSGDKTFLYRAFLKYETMDYGRNVYLIEAYSGDKVSKTELILNVLKPENDTSLQSEKEPIESEKVDTSNLPVGQYYGNPVELGDSKITYSDIKGLQIEKLTSTGLTLDSDSVNNFLSNKVEGWFFWNSLRPIYDNEGVSFFVIRLDGTKYIYEKHYFTPDGYYGVLQLETGEGIDISNLSDKNSEFKLKNDTYATVTIADMLFKNILSK